MKNLIVIAITGVLALLISVFLWNRSASISQPAATNQADNKEIRLRFGHNLPKNSAMHQAAIKFSQIVKNRSGGEITIDVYPNQQLGNDHKMVEMARAGELDILLTPTAKMSVPVPAIQLIDLPFLFPDRKTAHAVLDGNTGRLLLDKLTDIDLTGITFWENGFKQFTANQSITRPEDFNGLKIRVMKSRIIMQQFEALGATPVTIDFHATKRALEDGVVDGQENPLVAIVSMGFHEVQSHLTLSNHAYLGYVVSFSNKSIGKLTQQQQALLKESMLEITPWQREETRRREEEFIATVRLAGVTIEQLDDTQRQRFQQATKHIAEGFKPIIGEEILFSAYELISQQ